MLIVRKKRLSNMMEKKNIILDCDPGHDDAIAILLAGNNPKLNLLGITVVAGNQTIEKTAQNAFNVANYLNINVPIAIGKNNPLVRERVICEAIHGESGLDGFIFPKIEPKYDSRHAANFIIDTVLNNDDVTLVATGPLTNIALAIRLEPKIVAKIKEIVIMGGSIDHGNTSPAAEFNIMCDPEAAYIVFHSGAKVKMVGLNVTRQVLVLPEVISRMEKINNKASDLFVKLMRVFNENQHKTFNLVAGPLHDPVTIVSLIDESVVKFQKMNVEIDISHGPSYGRTNCDVFDYLHQEHNAEVAMEIDVDKYWDIIEQGIKSYS